MKTRITLILSLLLCAFMVRAYGADKPNIIVVLADDLGNADLGYRGSKIKTPNLDRLANTGVRLESYYGQQLCTPALIGDEAVKLIEAQDKTKPFFLYFAALAVHAPLQAPKEEIEAYAGIFEDEEKRAYAAMLTNLDTQIGRLVGALEKKGVRDNTIIFFTSDNGGIRKMKAHAPGGKPAKNPPASNGELRDGKSSLYEGGVRVPAIVNWPAKLKPAVVNEPLHHVDIMPTLLALAGAKGDDKHPFDGKDAWATLADGKPSPHEDILINVELFRGAIRKGNWKLVKHATLPGKSELFDLSTDIGEKKNVLNDHPDITKDLGNRLNAYAREQKMSEWFKAQPGFFGPQAKTAFDADFDIDDSGLPDERPALPSK